MSLNRYILVAIGMFSSLAFAPVFFTPALFVTGILCYKVYKSVSWHGAALCGFLFGFGHFLAGLYWIAIGVSVYIEEFWWALPFALFGLPIILGCFIAASCCVCWFMRSNRHYHFIFCICWVFFEWVRSWIFTGLPWNLFGYSLSFSEVLIQFASVFSIYGLSFIAIYITSSFHYVLLKQKCNFLISSITGIIILISMILYGTLKLYNNQTQFSNIQVRLVQPSIPQLAKWDQQQFWQHLNLHIALSQAPGNPDLIIWSEAALVVPYTFTAVKYQLLQMLSDTGAILVTGGITDNGKDDEDYQVYTTLYALNQDGEKLFEYRKSHLVPFGEYMPFKTIIPFKKLTHGFIDYTKGVANIVKLEQLNLVVRSLICYESIFPSEVRIKNNIADVIINITNDAWYGNSAGPYQHFYISRMRAVENGLPMIRVANNGISAIIDPLGRIIKKLDLNQIGFIDGFIPRKLISATLYSLFGDGVSAIIVFLVLLIQLKITFFCSYYKIMSRKA